MLDKWILGTQQKYNLEWASEVKMLKQVKAVQAESKQYCLQREKDFKAKVAGVLGYHGSGSTEVEEDNRKTILQTFWQNKDEVLDNLWSCLQFQPEVH